MVTLKQIRYQPLISIPRKISQPTHPQYNNNKQYISYNIIIYNNNNVNTKTKIFEINI